MARKYSITQLTVLDAVKKSNAAIFIDALPRHCERIYEKTRNRIGAVEWVRALENMDFVTGNRALVRLKQGVNERE